MSNGKSFQQNSPGWQIELGRQRFQEWWDLKMSQLEANTPDISLWDSSWLKVIVKILLWSLIAAIAVWLTWQLWLLLRPLIIDWNRQRKKFQLSAVDNPIEAQLSPQDWLKQAQEYYRQQNYRQGIFCLYQGILQYLSDRQIATMLSSRTDREYLSLIKSLNLKELLSYKLLFLTHEQLSFSNTSPSASLFEKCQEAYYSITNINNS